MRDVIPRMDEKVLVAFITRKLVILNSFVPISRKRMMRRVAILLLPLTFLILSNEELRSYKCSLPDVSNQVEPCYMVDSSYV